MKTFRINSQNQHLEMIRLSMYVSEALKTDKTYDIEVKEHRNKRSLNANAYCWVLLDKLAEKIGISKTEIYKGFIREIGGNSEVVCVKDEDTETLCKGWEHNGIGWQTDIMPSKIDGCQNVVLYAGSSTYNTKQMARLIDLCVAECKEQDIETLTPMELDRLKRDWGKAA